MSDAKKERIPLPPGWSKLGERGLLNVVAAVRLALLQVLARFENGRVSEARLLAQNERLKERIAQLKTELSIKDNRMGRSPVSKRPHYPHEERLRITRETHKLPPRPADPMKPAEAKSDARGVEAARPDHVWHCDLTVAAVGYWLPWFPLSVLLGRPFAW